MILTLSLPAFVALAQNDDAGGGVDAKAKSAEVKAAKPLDTELSANIRWPFPQRWLPVDAAGWTILKPGKDARLIYVSSKGGDDVTAKAYSPSSPEIGADPFLPTGELKAYATIEKAMEQARASQGDWVLLKRGDSWVSAAHRMPNGRSVTEPTVFGAYGPAAERPILRGDPRVSVGDHQGGAQYIVVTGIELYDSKKDPQSPDYAVVKGKDMRNCGIYLAVGKGHAFKNVLVEDCLLRYAMVNFINYAKEGRQSDTPITDVVIRRSLILDHYRPIGHTIGIWANDASFLLEECILDHNGWLNYPTPENRENKEPGIAIGLSHNTYLCNCYNVIFRGNIFLRGASQGSKWSSLRERGSPDLVVDDNLYAVSEITSSAGGNGVGAHRFVNMAMINNVVTHFGRDQGRSLAHGIAVTDWDGGLFAGNLFRGPRFPQTVQNYALTIASRQWHGGGGGGTSPLKPDDRPATPGKGLRNVSIADNTFYDMDGDQAVVEVVRGLDISQFLENVRFTGNRLQMPGLEKSLINISTGEIKKFHFSGNAYYSGGKAWFLVDGKPVDFTQWTQVTGEKNATDQPVKFTDSQRSLLSYMKHVGHEPTLEAFYAECRKQSKHNWRPQFTAPAVNDWIRQGFDMKKAELKKDESGRFVIPFQLVDSK